MRYLVECEGSIIIAFENSSGELEYTEYKEIDGGIIEEIDKESIKDYLVDLVDDLKN